MYTQNDMEHFAKAFEEWENGFRAEPKEFLTAEQVAEMGVSQVSAERAEYFLSLLNSTK